jgi:hypothetical protein
MEVMAPMATPKRAIIRLQLESIAKDRLDLLCKKRGMTQITIMSRLVDWFMEQDDVTQTAILSRLAPEALAPLAKKMLEKLTRNERV